MEGHHVVRKSNRWHKLLCERAHIETVLHDTLRYLTGDLPGSKPIADATHLGLRLKRNLGILVAVHSNYPCTALHNEHIS